MFVRQLKGGGVVAKSVTVIAPGQKVRIGTDGYIEGEVIEVSIAGVERLVMYRVAWWEGRNRRCEWLSSVELSRELCAVSTRIGFVTADDWKKNARCV